MRTPARLVLVLLAALACLARGAAPRAQAGACAPCGGTGRVPCAEHRAQDLALERDVLACTFYADCARCAGAGSLDCAGCTRAPAADERGAEAGARLAELGARMQRRVLAAASANFDLVCELEPMKAQRKKRSRHELLHLYLERLEEVRRAYLALFALAEEELTARSQVFLWADQADHLRAGRTFCGYETVDPEYRRGLEAISSIWHDPRKLADDAALHRLVVHHAVHGLMNVQKPAAWTGKLRMGWADEGLALWFEDHLLGAISGFCFWPEEEARGLRGGSWRAPLRKTLAATELELEAFLELDTVDMTREQHALGFTLVDHLAALDRARLNRLLASLRARTPPRDAFREVYDLSLAELEAAWRAWVLETYPKR